MSIPIRYYVKLSKRIDWVDGVPYWNESPSLNVKSGRVAGHIDAEGYRVICCSIDKIEKYIKAHRLRFYLDNNYLPKSIDHINGIKDDNKSINLRDGSGGINQRNIKIIGTSKYRGVCFVKSRNKWRANIDIKRKKISLGSFTSEYEAAKAYDSACIKYGIPKDIMNFKEDRA